MTAPDYASVTELAGEEVSREQIERLCFRYYWAAGYCRGRDVAEVACGSGQGLGYLAGLSGSFRAGDYSAEILALARRRYDGRIGLEQFDAQAMPYADASLDVVVIFEALYYLPSFERFLQECLRVLRSTGTLLLATANPDLYDFNPSPFSVKYYGVTELDSMLRRFGFIPEFFGNTPVAGVSLKQRVLRPVKKLVVASGLMPKSMVAKRLLKRLVFGELVAMPAEITADTADYRPPAPLSPAQPDHRHKVILCAAVRSGDNSELSRKR